MKLTQRRIGTLQAGRHGDSDCKTLFVVVQPSGSRAFVQRLTRQRQSRRPRPRRMAPADARRGPGHRFG